MTGQSIETHDDFNNIPSGVSIENMSYIETNQLEENEKALETNDHNEEEYTPKLFSEEQSYQTDENNLEADNLNNDNKETEQLFDQDANEEDFEIPAFLRKQKF